MARGVLAMTCSRRALDYSTPVTAFPEDLGDEQLAARLVRLGIRPEDVDESFVRSGGHGGQNVNKTSTCVVLLHRPTRLRIKSQSSRYQGINRQLAWRLLVDKLEALQERQAQAERARVEKARRQSRKPSRRAKERMLATKARRSDKKRARRFTGNE